MPAPKIAGLPTVALDPLGETVGYVNIRGTDYPVGSVTAEAFAQAQRIQEAYRAGEVPRPEEIFSMARALVPDMPADVAGMLQARQAMGIIAVATKRVEDVAALFPKVPAARRSPRRSPRRTR